MLPWWLYPLLAANIELLPVCTICLIQNFSSVDIKISPLHLLLFVLWLLLYYHGDGLYLRSEWCSHHDRMFGRVLALFNICTVLMLTIDDGGNWVMVIVSGSHMCIQRWDIQSCVWRWVASLNLIDPGSLVATVSGLGHLTHLEDSGPKGHYWNVQFHLKCIFGSSDWIFLPDCWWCQNFFARDSRGVQHYCHQQ